MSTLSLRDMARYKDLYEPIRAYLLDCWIEDKTPTLNGAARAVGELRFTAGRETYSTPMRTAYDHLAADGILLTEARADRSREGWSIRGANFTGRSPDGQTLREPVAAYLVDGNVRPADRQLLKEALRGVLEGMVSRPVAGTRTDEALLVAASDVPAERIRELPARGLALPTQKRNEYARAIRNLMRHAFRNNTVVVWTRPPRIATPWQQSVDAVLPLPTEGRVSVRTSAQRNWLTRLHRTLETLDGAAAGATLDTLLIADANRALLHIETAEADARAAREIRAVLTALGEDGHGPYRALQDARQHVVRLTDRHYGAAFTLTPADGTPLQATWASLMHTLRTRGVAEDEIAFYEWLADYSDLSGEALERRYGHRLVRPRIRKLSGLSYKARIQSIRSYVGLALLDLKWPASEATHAMVFGHRFPELTLRLRERWRQRAIAAAELQAEGLPVRGFAASEHAQTLERIIINGGLVAAAALERSRWARGLAGIPAATDKEGVEKPIRVGVVDIAEMAALSADEEAWAGAYRYANAKAEEIEAARGVGVRTHRDVRAIVEDVPSIALIPATLERLRTQVGQRPRERRVMMEAMHAFMRGIIVTGGPRVGELPRVRIGVHVDTARRDRDVSLQGRHRKVSVEHVLVIHRDLVPDWLYDYVVEVARPALVAPWQEKHGTSAGPAPDHGFLFVRASGAPYADAAWKPGMTEPSPQKRATASSSMLRTFAHWRRMELKAQGHPLTQGAWGHHTAHPSRHQMNQAGIACGFTESQMAKLLGHKGKSMGQVAYSASVAREIGHIISTILSERPWVGGYAQLTSITEARARGGRGRATAPVSGDAVARLLELKAQVDRGELSPKDLMATIQAISA